MRRLTKKMTEKWYSFVNEEELGDKSIDVVNSIINNWGKVEDLMEKYNIKNLKELEELIKGGIDNGKIN